jgi:hypothetical protein
MGILVSFVFKDDTVHIFHVYFEGNRVVFADFPFDGTKSAVAESKFGVQSGLLTDMG